MDRKIREVLITSLVLACLCPVGWWLRVGSLSPFAFLLGLALGVASLVAGYPPARRYLMLPGPRFRANLRDGLASTREWHYADRLRHPLAGLLPSVSGNAKRTFWQDGYEWCGTCDGLPTWLRVEGLPLETRPVTMSGADSVRDGVHVFPGRVICEFSVPTDWSAELTPANGLDFLRHAGSQSGRTPPLASFQALLRRDATAVTVRDGIASVAMPRGFDPILDDSKHVMVFVAEAAAIVRWLMAEEPVRQQKSDMPWPVAMQPLAHPRHYGVAPGAGKLAPRKPKPRWQAYEHAPLPAPVPKKFAGLVQVVLAFVILTLLIKVGSAEAGAATWHLWLMAAASAVQIGRLTPRARFAALFARLQHVLAGGTAKSPETSARGSAGGLPVSIKKASDRYVFPGVGEVAPGRMLCRVHLPAGIGMALRLDKEGWHRGLRAFARLRGDRHIPWRAARRVALQLRGDVVLGPGGAQAAMFFRADPALDQAQEIADFTEALATLSRWLVRHRAHSAGVYPWAYLSTWRQAWDRLRATVAKWQGPAAVDLGACRARDGAALGLAVPRKRRIAQASHPSSLRGQRRLDRALGKPRLSRRPGRMELGSVWSQTSWLAASA